MNARRMPIGVMVGAPLLIGLGVFAFTTQEPVPDSEPPGGSPTAEASVDAAPTDGDPWTDGSGAQTAFAETRATMDAISVPPTPTPAVAQRGDFGDGAWVRVNAGAGDCLNARNQPTVASDWVIVQACLPDGFEGMISGNASEAEGRWWWYLAGSGWVAEEYLAYVRDADLTQARAPALAGHGRIAYVRDGDIWLMDADGDNQRMIIDTPPESAADGFSWSSTSGLRWSPDGTMLSYTIASGGPDGYVTTLHVAWVAPDGRVLRSEAFERAFGGGWSPDSTRIAILSEAGRQDMGAMEGVPGTIELATGLRSVFDSTVQFYSATPEFNHDGTMLLYQHPGTPTNDPAGGRPIEAAHIRITDTDGAEITRIPIPANGWITQPHWSPVDDRIAFHLSDGGDPSYAVYDLVQARIVQRVPVPRTSDRIGGGCGGADMWRLDWNRDGTSILYSFSSGDTGANGVWTWNLPTNSTKVTFAASAGAASPGTEGRFVFSTYGAGAPYIFWAREGDGFPSIIAEGAAPVWAP